MHSAQALFFLNAAIWMVLGIVSIYRIPSRSPEQVSIAWVVAMLMFGNAAAMLLSGVVIARPGRFGYAFALAVLGINILLTFTDQVGALDLFTLLIDMLLLVLLIIARKGIKQTANP
jgi:hypothetical protein